MTPPTALILIDPASTGNSLIVKGKIGIGTTAPSEGLEVAGNIKLTGAGTITFPDATTQTSAAESALVYKRIFVTSTTYTGNLGGLSGADAKCQARADAASLTGTWKAVLSTTTVNAKDRIGYSWDGLVNLLGQVVYLSPRSLRPSESNITGVFGSSELGKLLITETGLFFQLGLRAWTGTNQYGEMRVYGYGSTCAGWTNATTETGCHGGGGESTNQDDWHWVAGAYGGGCSQSNCSLLLNIYCIEQ